MCKNDPKYIAIGDFEGEWLKGFLLASAYRNYYTQELVMDVKDCIVNPEVNNVYTVTRLFNFMIDHLEYHGGRYWRADSIASSSPEYVEFLKKKYNAVPFHGVHGEIQEVRMGGGGGGSPQTTTTTSGIDDEFKPYLERVLSNRS